MCFFKKKALGLFEPQGPDFNINILATWDKETKFLSLTYK